MAIRKAKASSRQKPSKPEKLPSKTRKASPKEEMSSVKAEGTNKQSRIQTAEGWKRAQLKKRHLLKTETKR